MVECTGNIAAAVGSVVFNEAADESENGVFGIS